MPTITSAPALLASFVMPRFNTGVLRLHHSYALRLIRDLRQRRRLGVSLSVGAGQVDPICGAGESVRFVGSGIWSDLGFGTRSGFVVFGSLNRFWWFGPR